MEKTYHFTGIKGSGMSALALMLHQMGKNVQGSDSTDYRTVEQQMIRKREVILKISGKTFLTAESYNFQI